MLSRAWAPQPRCLCAAWTEGERCEHKLQLITLLTNDHGASVTRKGTGNYLILSEKSLISLRLVGSGFLKVIEEKGRRV